MVGGRCLLESELPVRGRGPIVVLVLEEDLVEMSQSDALCPLQVPQARRVPLRHGDDARRVVLLHDAVHCPPKHGLEGDLEGDELLLAAVREGYGLGFRGVHRR